MCFSDGRIPKPEKERPHQVYGLMRAFRSGSAIGKHRYRLFISTDPSILHVSLGLQLALS